MPRTIEEWFRDFNDKLKLIKTESDSLKSHRKSISDCLVSNFWLNRFFRTGSIGLWTNVSWYSDTDYFAWIPTDKLKQNSHSTLVNVKEVLQKRFPRTNIFISSPAVVVDFWSAKSETTEIIPADYIKTENGVNIYDIPDSKWWWMKSSPKAWNDYVTKINSDLSFKVKPLIRFIKALKYYNNIPISSYYLEMRVAQYSAWESSILYLIDIKRILKKIIDLNLSNMINPTWIWWYIDACSSDAKKTESISKLNSAYKRICYAYDEEQKWNIKEAFYWINLAFNEKFPSYDN